MCGICGIFHVDGAPVEAEVLGRMNDSLAHRGPDDFGLVILNNDRESVGLAQRRLAIIDLSKAAHQPMSNECGSIWITYNGEIYNFVSIREKLKAKGHQFASSSDTEVIIHAYEEWGNQCLNQLNGMFAFAIWDTKRRELFLARDRLGIKPVIYFWDGKTFAFSSEISGLFSVLGNQLTINHTGFAFYATLGYIPAPYTSYGELHKLEPGHFIIIRNGSLRKQQYWDVDFSQKIPCSVRDLIKEVPQKFGESVSRQLVSDVPLGAFLSGGIDSSAVVAMMSNSNQKIINTFSIGFPQKNFDETPFARIVAKHCKTDHHDFVLTPNAVSVLPKLVQHFGEPFADSSAIPTYYLSEMTSKYVKVALSGDGGDELFCGYTIYLGHKISELYKLMPKYLRHLILRGFKKFRWSNDEQANLTLLTFQKHLENAELNPVERVLSKNSMFPETFGRILDLNIDIDPVRSLFENLLNNGDADSFLDRIAYLQVKLSLPNDMLTKVDRMSMAHSLEVRLPFLDHEFVEYVSKIPTNIRFRFWTSKWLLKKAMLPFLPKEIIYRKKWGFNVPLGAWLKNEKEYANNSTYKGTDHRISHGIWGKRVFDEWKKQQIGVA
jgi:asparagine synthase (glutamine-hydrolysing)